MILHNNSCRWKAKPAPSLFGLAKQLGNGEDVVAIEGLVVHVAAGDPVFPPGEFVQRLPGRQAGMGHPPGVLRDAGELSPTVQLDGLDWSFMVKRPFPSVI